MGAGTTTSAAMGMNRLVKVIVLVVVVFAVGLVVTYEVAVRSDVARDAGSWHLDPRRPFPTEESTRIAVLVSYSGCATEPNFRSKPTIRYGKAAIVVHFRGRRSKPHLNCTTVGLPPVAQTIDLRSRLGNRRM